MSSDGGVDPEALRQALEIVSSGGGAITEPALVARLEFNRAAQLIRDGHTGEGEAIVRRLASPPAGAEIPPPIGLEAAKAWADLAFQRQAWNEVIEAERGATAHLGALNARTETLFSRDAASADRGQLATMAAYAAAKTGAFELAVSILEQGRTRMIAERLRSRAGPVSTRTLNTPDDYPVVHLMPAPEGGLALVSTGTAAASPVWLDRQGPSAFQERLNSYFSALDGVHRNGVLGMGGWVAEVANMVAFLQAMLGPLFAALPSGPLTVVPVGAMSALPITAAALGAGGSERSITILPSTGLGLSRAAGTATDRVFIVTEPTLPSARWEGAGVRGFFARPDAPEAGTAVPEMIAAFPPGGVVHFSCHGDVDVGAPLRSGLDLPGGGRLTVEDILTADLPAVAAVVLSACESGLSGPYLFDEAISLPTAFLAAGCGGVVSTLWIVEDLSSALVMLRFYWEWRHESCPAPLALARAQNWLRTASDLDKCRYVSADLVRAHVLSDDDGAALAGHIRARSASMTGNIFAEPYYWAGFYYTGRPDPAGTQPA
jgi:hypothetical protein